MIDFILCAVSNLFRVYLIYRFAKVFFGKAIEGNLKKIVKGAIFYLTNMILYWKLHIAWVNGICNLVGIGLIMCSYTSSRKKILYVTVSVFMINLGSDLVITRLFTNYRDGIAIDQIYTTMVVLLILICELLTERIINIKSKKEDVQSIFLIMVPFCSIGMLSVLDYMKCITNIGLVIVSACLLLLNFFVLSLYNVLSDMFSQKYENEILRQKVQSYANQLDILVQSEEKVTALRHDMKHHMNELKLMAFKNECMAIRNYIDDMENYLTNKNELVSSGNLEIDSVLNYMLQQAKKNLNDVNIKLCIPKSLSHSFDINVILGNLLENAIEAAEQTEEKRLDVNIRLRRGVLRIDIENSFNGKLERELLTTKKNKNDHGIGLNNVKKIVEKYDGSIQINPHGNTFAVKLIIYMPEI